MSLNCEIVKDLVALYTDNSANPKTVAEIEEHLSQCEDCANYYKRYQKINEKSPVLSDEPFAAPLSYTKLATPSYPTDLGTACFYRCHCCRCCRHLLLFKMALENRRTKRRITERMHIYE